MSKETKQTIEKQAKTVELKVIVPWAIVVSFVLVATTIVLTYFGTLNMYNDLRATVIKDVAVSKE